MSLDYWAEQGWIQEVETSGEDIVRLLSLARQNIDEALELTHSDQWKFNILYAAIINLASCALRACRYRVTSSGSHYYLIQSLEQTIDLDSDTVSTLDSYRKKRNIATYEQEGMISPSEANEIEEVTSQLLRDVEKWLGEHRSEMLGG